jgi:hypothetical protein
MLAFVMANPVRDVSACIKVHVFLALRYEWSPFELSSSDVKSHPRRGPITVPVDSHNGAFVNMRPHSITQGGEDDFVMQSDRKATLLYITFDKPSTIIDAFRVILKVIETVLFPVMA